MREYTLQISPEKNLNPYTAPNWIDVGHVSCEPGGGCFNLSLWFLASCCLVAKTDSPSVYSNPLSISTWFLKYRLSLDFFFNFKISSLRNQKIHLITKLIFVGYTGSKNQVRTRKKIKFDSKSIFFWVCNKLPNWYFKNQAQIDTARD